MSIVGKGEQRWVLKVSAMPVYDDAGQPRGTMASFDDVTEIEQNRVELRQMLDTISESRDEIHRQNLQLEHLASRDALTNCLNRRAFFAELATLWSEAERNGYPLACIMFDLDHFKLINDTHGHQAGDMVLERAAELLRGDRQPSDLVCRYGGEEFCLILPHTDLDHARAVAETIRQTLAEEDFGGLRVTASIGVSARSLGPADPQQLIDQADKSLYVAKRSGRNQVVCFDPERDEDRANETAAQVGAASQNSGTVPAAAEPQLSIHTGTDAASKLSALIEQLAAALAVEDFDEIAELSAHLPLASVARDRSLGQAVASLNDALERAAGSEELSDLANNLLAMCRTPQPTAGDTADDEPGECVVRANDHQKSRDETGKK